jgi:hypothetical protein
MAKFTKNILEASELLKIYRKPTARSNIEVQARDEQTSILVGLELSNHRGHNVKPMLMYSVVCHLYFLVS